MHRVVVDEGADVAEVSSSSDLGVFLLRWDITDGEFDSTVNINVPYVLG